jgi:hypothetical protein
MGTLWILTVFINDLEPKSIFLLGLQLTQPLIAVNVPPHLDPHQRHLWGIPPSPHHLFGYSVPNSNPYGYNQVFIVSSPF